MEKGEKGAATSIDGRDAAVAQVPVQNNNTSVRALDDLPD